MSTFTKATKKAAKARVAFDGPSGAGKTWTALEWASVLGKRAALIDTERGSASLYADHFDFDVLEMAPPYDPQRLVDVLRSAEHEGYDVVVIDSMSHFWEAEGGVLDIVDGAAQRAKGNSFAGWKVGTPAHRHLLDTILGLDAHVIATMRAKSEYVLETNAAGKQVPRRVGMAPVQRAGVEYEFTLFGDLDLEHRITFTKSRCDLLADAVIQPKRAAEAAHTFKDWLDSGDPVATRHEVAELVDTMNRLPDQQRAEAKAGFVERFGHPDHLLAARVDEAAAYVASFAPSAEREETDTTHPASKDQPSAPSIEQAPPTPPGSGAANGGSAGADPAAAPEPARITRPQETKLHAGFGNRDRADRLAVLSAFVGRELGTMSDMSKAEATRAIEAKVWEK